MRIVRLAYLAALGLAGAWLAWLIVVAQLGESVFVGGPRVAALPWGWVTIVDVYLGFAVFGGYICVREGSWRRALPWLLALAIAGNVASAAYVLFAVWKDGFDLTALVRRSG